eukprot:366366-Chlamydomonas_euryale.AAC.8
MQHRPAHSHQGCPCAHAHAAEAPSQPHGRHHSRWLLWPPRSDAPMRPARRGPRPHPVVGMQPHEPRPATLPAALLVAHPVAGHADAHEKVHAAGRHVCERVKPSERQPAPLPPHLQRRRVGMPQAVRPNRTMSHALDAAPGASTAHAANACSPSEPDSWQGCWCVALPPHWASPPLHVR